MCFEDTPFLLSFYSRMHHTVSGLSHTSIFRCGFLVCFNIRDL